MDRSFHAGSLDPHELTSLCLRSSPFYVAPPAADDDECQVMSVLGPLATKAKQERELSAFARSRLTGMLWPV